MAAGWAGREGRAAPPAAAGRWRPLLVPPLEGAARGGRGWGLLARRRAGSGGCGLVCRRRRRRGRGRACAPAMDRFSWTSGLLELGETLVVQQRGVRLCDGEEKVTGAAPRGAWRGPREGAQGRALRLSWQGSEERD